MPDGCLDAHEVRAVKCQLHKTSLVSCGGIRSCLQIFTLVVELKCSFISKIVSMNCLEIIEYTEL